MRRSGATRSWRQNTTRHYGVAWRQWRSMTVMQGASYDLWARGWSAHTRNSCTKSAHDATTCRPQRSDDAAVETTMNAATGEPCGQRARGGTADESADRQMEAPIKHAYQGCRRQAANRVEAGAGCLTGVPWQEIHVCRYPWCCVCTGNS